MSVKIDAVYQKVLAFANKEQRGYITPQEFNLFADQAQNEIFDQYFYDLKQFSQENRSSAEYADMYSYLNEKIDVFKRENTFYTGSTGTGNLTSNAYQIGDIWDTTNYIIEEVDRGTLQHMYRSKKLKPLDNKPVYTRTDKTVYIHPTENHANETFFYEYIKIPSKPSWTYVVVNGVAMYDPNNGSLNNFELHASEENELVYKILKFAGISMRKDDVLKAGQGLESVNIQQQKQ